MRIWWIYDKVCMLVKKYKTRDPKELIDCLNIKLIYLNNTENLLGMYNVVLRTRVIYISRNAGYLTNTILAHELGHDMLHRKECISGKTFKEFGFYNVVDTYENEANIFAAHLLIDNDELNNKLYHLDDFKEIAYELGVEENLLAIKLCELKKIRMLKDLDFYIERPLAIFLQKYKPEKDVCFYLP